MTILSLWIKFVFEDEKFWKFKEDIFQDKIVQQNIFIFIRKDIFPYTKKLLGISQHSG